EAGEGMSDYIFSISIPEKYAKSEFNVGKTHNCRKYYRLDPLEILPDPYPTGKMKDEIVYILENLAL
ncbi:MAG: hypothetical protein NT118_08250, partial [Lentisphaerae bacterium]|nr:hypothetical protein [Lentisphaerota bacterium]